MMMMNNLNALCICHENAHQRLLHGLWMQA